MGWTLFALRIVSGAAPGLFNGDRFVDAIFVVKVNMVDAEALKRSITCPSYIFGLAIYPDPPAVFASFVTELGSYHDILSSARDSPAYQALVCEGSVHISGVKQRYAEIKCAVNRGDRLAFVRGAIELAHPHAAETFGGNLKTLPQYSSFHVRSSTSSSLPTRAKHFGTWQSFPREGRLWKHTE